MLSRAYYNSEFVNTADIRLPSTDLGIHRGYGIFDFFKLRDRTNPWLEWYLDRFENSLRLTRLSIGINRIELKELIEELLKQNQVKDTYIKIVVTAGPSDNGYIRNHNASLLIYAMSLPDSDKNSTATGVLITDEYRRDMPGVKTINYIRSCILQAEMQEAGAIDVLYHWNGWISEASRSNIFVAKDGKFKTPGIDILNGITRQRVLSLQLQEVPIEESKIKIEDVFGADEVFITSSTKGVMPILSIDGREIGNGKTGELTAQLMQKINVF